MNEEVIQEMPENFEQEAPALKGEAPRRKRQAKAETVVVVSQATGEVQGEIEMAPAEKEEPKAQPKDETKPVAVHAPRPQVGMDERGRAAAGNLEEMFRLANALFKGQAFPNWVKSPEQALGVCIFLKNLGLEVMTGIQHVCVVNGRLSLWGEGPLAAVRASGKLKTIKEGFYTKDYEEICFKNKNLDADLHFAYCVTVRKDTGERKETWFSVKDESTANKGLDAVWKGYKRTMYKRKARAENLKDNFGDVLQGAGVSEYDDESAPDMPVETPKSLADRLAERIAIPAPKEEPNGQAIQD